MTVRESTEQQVWKLERIGTDNNTKPRQGLSHHRTRRRIGKYWAEYIWKWGQNGQKEDDGLKNLKKENDPPSTLPNTAPSGDSPSSSSLTEGLFFGQG